MYKCLQTCCLKKCIRKCDYLIFIVIFIPNILVLLVYNIKLVGTMNAYLYFIIFYINLPFY